MCFHEQIKKDSKIFVSFSSLQATSRLFWPRLEVLQAAENSLKYLAQIRNLVKDTNFHCFILEDLKGGDFEAYLKEVVLPELKRFFHQIACADDYIHSKRVARLATWYWLQKITVKSSTSEWLVMSLNAKKNVVLRFTLLYASSKSFGCNITIQFNQRCFWIWWHIDGEHRWILGAGGWGTGHKWNNLKFILAKVYSRRC